MRSMILVQSVRSASCASLAAKASLWSFGPPFTNPTDRARIGCRHAIVIEPGVEAGSGGANARVVRKALVELRD